MRQPGDCCSASCTWQMIRSSAISNSLSIPRKETSCYPDDLFPIQCLLLKPEAWSPCKLKGQSDPSGHSNSSECSTCLEVSPGLSRAFKPRGTLWLQVGCCSAAGLMENAGTGWQRTFNSVASISTQRPAPQSESILNHVPLRICTFCPSSIDIDFRVAWQNARPIGTY